MPQGALLLYENYYFAVFAIRILDHAKSILFQCLKLSLVQKPKR